MFEAVTIHEVTPDDWQSHRDLRLAMLLDAPDAFYTQYSDVAGFDEARWRERLASATHFQARLGDEPLGSVGIWEDPDASKDAVTLVAMFVAPHARRQGVGERLVQRVLDEAVRQGKRRVLLEVTSSNDAAYRLYSRMGFVPNGSRRDHPRKSELFEIDMEIVLPGAPAAAKTGLPGAVADVEG
jgi:ribosomal protein S18 acetylase RimI-like enzyme